MDRTLLCFVSVFLAFAASAAEHKPMFYIMNGTDATVGQFPWQVMILLNGKFVCGGALITRRWVVTAARCWSNSSQITLRIGSLLQGDFESGRIEIQVPTTNYFVNHMYTENPYLNDIALIKLPVALNLSKKSNATIATIRLPRGPPKTYANMSAITSGWGRTNPTDTSVDSTTLKYVINPVTINQDCKNVMGIANISSISHICTTTSNFTKGFCDRDTGGPLVVKEKDKKYTLIGINSFTLGVSCVDGYDTFTRVSEFVPWIDWHIKNK